ncbi:DMT family transporter [Spiribacter halobius]|uniref:DMT family transporter n=1 Tax=Sediminicurvatus halobius TaxID=2182432 RepID=UPI0027E53CDB|nr:DMT family transporter [Spiribacter halobius]
MSTRTTAIPGTRPTDHARGMTIAFCGVLAISFDALLVRLADAGQWEVVFWRGWLIFAALAVVSVVRGEAVSLPASRRGRLAIAVAVLLMGGNTALFVLSVSNTAAANTVVILAAAPFFAALFSWLLLREAVRRRTWIAIVAAMTGVVVVCAGGLQVGTWLGDFYAVLLAICLGGALTLLRRYPGVGRIPVVCASGAVAGLLAWPFAEPLGLGLQSYAALGVMGLLQMPLAMVLMATATRYLPSPEVSLFLLLETVLGPVWVWLVLDEGIPLLTLYGGAVVLATVAIHSWLALRDEA